MLRSATPFDEVDQDARIRFAWDDIVANISTELKRSIRAQIEAAAEHAVLPVA